MRDIIELQGIRFLVQTERDEDHGAPWDEECGHGPVSDWTTRHKRSGELELSDGTRGLFRYYDFQEACKIARRDGWGFLPGTLKTEELKGGAWYAWVEPKSFAVRNKTPRLFQSIAEDANEAIRQVYALHRATMTARQYAAGAAMADFERLHAWCNDEWEYVGVIVTRLDSDGEETDDTESLWGIESDSDDYLQEVAEELAGEILSRYSARMAAEIEESRPDMVESV